MKYNINNIVTLFLAGCNSFLSEKINSGDGGRAMNFCLPLISLISSSENNDISLGREKIFDMLWTPHNLRGMRGAFSDFAVINDISGEQHLLIWRGIINYLPKFAVNPLIPPFSNISKAVDNKIAPIGNMVDIIHSHLGGGVPLLIPSLSRHRFSQEVIQDYKI